jgi:hypothetical protein
MIDLFSIPIYITKVPNHDYIKNIILNNLETNDVPETWNCSVNSSFKVYHDWLHKLSDCYTEIYKDFFSKFNCTADITVDSIWYNEYTVNDFQEHHHHLPADFSCIHYIKLDKDHHGTTFVNPNRLINSSNKLLKKTSPELYTPHVLEGDIIIFPSYLEHFVKKQDIVSRRVTLSWNLKIDSFHPLTPG